MRGKRPGGDEAINLDTDGTDVDDSASASDPKNLCAEDIAAVAAGSGSFKRDNN